MLVSSQRPHTDLGALLNMFYSVRSPNYILGQLFTSPKCGQAFVEGKPRHCPNMISTDELCFLGTPEGGRVSSRQATS